MSNPERMLEHRLGLALGKSLAEIRAMPYSEFRRWQMYDLVEPIGWPDAEYRTAVVLAMLYNANRGKGRAKDVKDFMRNNLEGILKELRTLQKQEELETMPAEQKREYLLSQIKKDFGIR